MVLLILITLLLFVVVLIVALYVYCRLTCGICKCSRQLVGKTVIVTGGNAGIGLETARDLAWRGARVLLACRSEPRGLDAVTALRAHTRNPNIHYRHLDLSDLASVRAFAHHILATEPRLDILINNAGVFDPQKIYTKDNLLLIMQVNHFGHFLLTSLLLPLIKSSSPSRIINVSSTSHIWAKLDFNDINMHNFTPDLGIIGTFTNRMYSNSKMCNILFTIELAKRLKGSGVTVNSLCPGTVETDILRPIKIFHYLSFLRKRLAKTPWEGAQTSVYLAVSPEVDDVTGAHFRDCKRQDISNIEKNEQAQRKLWDISEKLVKLK